MDGELTAGLDLSLGLVTCDSEPTVRLLTRLGLHIELGICSKLSCPHGQRAYPWVILVTWFSHL